ncbi:tetratricopeptide repeat protein [Magnetospirillum sp. SS-4]|uniref:O-linked N-acetylglucosamine transferase family protein n=1 Tax=Magnetospirillum sp. SS-4 TaxID=2681465 RepID=UPI00138030C2|nr:tetratricopeptide repeat protein [Magnetospirillum sp. SS-4]CAA7617729.1 hypothetical protein MTBSS4_20023 [Magnetospirillum sp. SS-4]
MNDIIELIQAGRLVEARTALEAGLDASNDPEFRRMLGRLVLHQGDAALAAAHFGQVAGNWPDLPDVWFELGIARLGCGLLEEAAAAFDQELKRRPDHAGAAFNLAWTLRRLGRDEAAAARFRALLAHRPDHGAAWFNLGNILAGRGELEKAAEAFTAALPCFDDQGGLLINLGDVRQRQGRLADARECYERAVRLPGGGSAAANNLGNLLTSMGLAEEAVAAFEEALRLDGDDPKTACNLALALNVLRRREQAETLLRRAVALAPDNAWAWNCLGVVGIARNHLDEAEAALRRAIDLDPSLAQAHSNLGAVHGDRCRNAEALACLRRAHDLAPEDPAIHSNLLFLLRHSDGLDPRSLFEEHRRYGEIQERLAAPLPPAALDRRHDRLRIGYVSPDFREHAVSLFFEPILERHDTGRFEIYCYHTDNVVDEVTERLKAKAAHWRNIAGVSADVAAAQVRADEIDILIDLAGHSARNGLPVFVRKPAPVQVTWLGYPDTTGLTRIDYRITDLGSDPPGRNDEFYTETLLRLPAQSSFRPPVDCPGLRSPPSLGSHRIRFGSFNKPAKLNDQVITTWGAVLRAVPDSTLLMVVPGGDRPAIRDDIRSLFRDAGIDPGRIEVTGQRPLRAFLDLVSSVDIALDSFPYSGGTTTTFTLWMGVPVICMEGDGAASGSSRGLLDSVGGSGWVARSASDYVSIARKLAGDPDELARLRPRLRRRMEDLTRHAMGGMMAGLERALTDIWLHYSQGVPLIRMPSDRPRNGGEILARHDARMAVSVFRDGRAIIMMVDGAGMRPVGSAFGGDQITPRFSPDRRRLAFAEHDGAAFQIVIADLGSGRLTVLSEGRLHNAMPAWDGAGTRLVWHAAEALDIDHGDTSEIYVWEGTGAPRRLTRNSRMDCYPAFLPDGDGVVFESGRHDEAFGLFKVDWQGVETPIHYDTSRWASGIPDLAADGEIVFETADVADLSAYSVAALREGGTPRLLSPWSVAANPTPRLSPDGLRVAAHGPGATPGTLLIHVGRRDAWGEGAVFGHEGDCLQNPRWSASGRLIAAEDRIRGVMVVVDLESGLVSELAGCDRIRAQQFLEIWNFDIA